jgi:hypothetical protein
VTPSPSAAREAAAASLLLLWRAWVVPLSDVWRDWFAILCAFWIFTALGSRTRAWPFVAGATMAALLALYGVRQLGLGR